MKKTIKNYALIACLAVGLTAGVTGLSSSVAIAEGENYVSTRLTMSEGATLYLGEEFSGLKFTYQIADYNAETDNGNIFVTFAEE